MKKLLILILLLSCLNAEVVEVTVLHQIKIKEELNKLTPKEYASAKIVVYPYRTNGNRIYSYYYIYYTKD